MDEGTQSLFMKARSFWGIGLSMSDPRRLDRPQWRGQNLLGYARMMARVKLSAGPKFVFNSAAVRT